MSTENNASKKQRRVSYSHGPYVDQVAEIYVSCGEYPILTERQVRNEIPALSHFGRSSLRDWADTPEGRKALQAARDKAAIKKDLDERRRGRAMFRWALDTLEHLMKEQEQAMQEQRTDDAVRLEDRIIKLNELVTEEEKHFARSEEQEDDDERPVRMIFNGPEEETVPPDEI